MRCGIATVSASTAEASGFCLGSSDHRAIAASRRCACSTSRPLPNRKDSYRRVLPEPRPARLAAAGSTSRSPPNRRDSYRQVLPEPRPARLAAAGSASRSPPNRKDSRLQALPAPRPAHLAAAGSTSRMPSNHTDSCRPARTVQAKAGRRLRRAASTSAAIRVIISGVSAAPCVRGLRGRVERDGNMRRI
jgi:hypothetical protein